MTLMLLVSYLAMHKPSITYRISFSFQKCEFPGSKKAAVQESIRVGGALLMVGGVMLGSQTYRASSSLLAHTARVDPFLR